MSDERSARIAQLRGQMAQEQAAEQRAVLEAKMKHNLEKGVLKAVETVEEVLDSKLKKLDELENMGEDELDQIRERRLRQVKEAAAKSEQLRARGHGTYRSVTEEREFFAQVKTSTLVVAHFGRNATPRCEIVDGHLSKLAQSHLETKFIRVEAERTPYLADKLKISVLPSIVLIKNNKTEHTLVGFEEFGGVDDFPTSVVEQVLYKYGLVTKLSEEFQGSRFGKSTAAIRKGNTSTMDDWED